MKKILALVISVLLVMSVLTVAFADPTTPSITITAASTSESTQTDTTEYHWYRLLEALIDTDPTSSGATQSGGAVTYYTDSAAKVTELNKLGVFTITEVAGASPARWYVELTSSSTDGAAIANAIKTASAAETNPFNVTVFPTGSFEQDTVGGTATSGTVAPGYYYVTSTAGTAVVLQTLTAVSITEKNTFPPVDKIITPDDEDIEIGATVHYTLTVEVPSTANDVIVLTDTMDPALDYGQIVSVKSNAEGTPDVAYTTNPASPTAANVHANNNVFTITFTAATVTANQGKTITVEYEAVVNNSAVVQTNIPNTIKLNYGNDYESKPKTVNTKTYPFTFDKVDGTDTTQKLTGAEFELRKAADATAAASASAVQLIAVTAGQIYRVATPEEIADSSVTKTTTIVTDGHTVTINGLDLDLTTYFLVETKAPTGYNGLHAPINLTAGTTEFVHEDVVNNKGQTLPSTGGIGTTLFYVGGGILILLAVVLLVTKRRMSSND